MTQSGHEDQRAPTNDPAEATENPLYPDDGRSWNATKQRWVCVPKTPVRIDLVTESLNVSGDGHAVMLLPDPVRLAVQVEEPT
jgi:hypothetical protein